MIRDIPEKPAYPARKPEIKGGLPKKPIKVFKESFLQPKATEVPVRIVPLPVNKLQQFE